MSIESGPGRTESGSARLLRIGYADPGRAQRHLRSLGPVAEHVLESVADVADPDLATGALDRLLSALGDAAGEVATALAVDVEFRRRLLLVLGHSAALGDHLERHPGHWRDLYDETVATSVPTPLGLRRHLLSAVGADPDADLPSAPASAPGGVLPADALRVEYRRQLLRVAARDLSGDIALDEVAAELADLAAATIEAALAVARGEMPDRGRGCRIAVIGMGKCGGRELNYVSDVDVVFVAEPADGASAEDDALRVATELATRLIRVCSQQTAEGVIWPVDAGLRPEGKNGPLVRTLASHRAYYERWAKTWEFQALLKARPIAGDPQLGQDYLAMVSPMVWHAAARDSFVEDVQTMRRRVEQYVKPAEAERQLKLGRGGLRDVEFAVQLLQLVHGRFDESLRSGTTLVALEALTTGGYVGRRDGATLDSAYRFLRTLEHRIQLHRLRRTHVLPRREADLRRLGRSMGLMSDSSDALQEEWRRQAREVRRLHEKLFYRPLLTAVARLPGEEDGRLSVDAARHRLEALGYADPDGALRHIEALTTGVSRRAAIQRTLLPVMLGWFADSADPDGGLAGFRQVSDTVGATPWYLRLLRDVGTTAERMARVLGSSRYATELLLRAPEVVAMLADDEELHPRDADVLANEVSAAFLRHDHPASVVDAVRAMRRRELFRISAADLLGALSVDEVGDGLTVVADATLAAAVRAAMRAVRTQRGRDVPTRFGVLAMGRLGGGEMGYGSDADVIFVHDPLPGVPEQDATKAALAIANEIRHLLALPGPEPPMAVDADLRPEGKNGPLVRTLASYAAYYRRWVDTWERQALLRARPVAGDAGLLSEFLTLIEPLRYPADGLDETEAREIRRVKARVEGERLPRGADPSTHTKLGRGGLADVEWTVQLLQLRHAGAVPELRTTGTLPALQVAAKEGLVTRADADVLAASWRLASRVRNAMMLVRSRPSDQLPNDPRELAALSRVLGYEPGESARFVNDYRRTTRRARTVVERVFYG